MKAIQDEMPPGVELFDFDDHAAHRRLIYDDVKSNILAQYPYSHNGVRMELHEVDYVDPEDVSLADQKKALLGDKYLSRRLKGTVRLFDDKTGDLLDEKPNITLMRVPHLTNRGTYIHGGNEYVSIMQARLRAGVYTRRQKNGELETQFNVKPGSGSAFRVGFEPETSQYRMKIQQANLHLYSLLKDLGVPDEHLERSWGKEILDANRKRYDSRVLDKAYQRLVPKRNVIPEAARDVKVAAIREALDKQQVSGRVTRRNLPNMFDMSKAAEWREAHVKQAAAQPVRTEEEEQRLDAVMRLKQAVFSTEDVQSIGLFLNKECGAGIDVTADQASIEEQVMKFISDESINPAVLQAGIDGLKAVQAQKPPMPKIASYIVRTPPIGLTFLEKMARFGAGVLFKQPNGKYLLQENTEEDVDTDEKDIIGKLRPAGGGKHKSDANLRATILREIDEEFGIPPEVSKDKISLMGYITRGKFRDCALYVMEDHGLRPGVYQADNSVHERVKLVEADLDDERYIGPKLDSLRRYAIRGYHGRGPNKRTKSASEAQPAHKPRFVTFYELEGFSQSIEEGQRRQREVDAETWGTKSASGFHRPENWDKVDSGGSDTTGYSISTGANDWEGSTTWIWVEAAGSSYSSGRGLSSPWRVWLELKFPKYHPDYEKLTEEDTAEHKAHAEKARSTWKKLAEKLYEDQGYDASWADAFEEALNDEKMEPFIETSGRMQQKWVDKKASSDENVPAELP